ncbi:MAG: alpha/beta hydrolase [Sphingobacteriales bacterium]|nr:MAG: alpha/beta hydrolase [Sphingobacteriales bacterium]
MRGSSASNSPSYLQWGTEGPVLVLLHYFGGEAASWQWVAPLLQTEYRCIAINLPGCGGTVPPAVLSLKHYSGFVQQLLTSLNIDRYTLIGHSMGAKIAMQVAADVPQAIQRLVLIAPSPPSTEPLPEPDRQQSLSHRDSSASAEETLNRITIQLISEAQRQLFISSQLATAPAVWNWWLLTGMGASIAGAVQHIQAPVTVLSSSQDPVITPQVIRERVAPFFPEAQFISSSNAGHLLPFEVPDWVADQVRTACRSSFTINTL